MEAANNLNVVSPLKRRNSPVSEIKVKTGKKNQLLKSEEKNKKLLGKKRNFSLNNERTAKNRISLRDRKNGSSPMIKKKKFK